MNVTCSPIWCAVCQNIHFHDVFFGWDEQFFKFAKGFSFQYVLREMLGTFALLFKLANSFSLWPLIWKEPCLESNQSDQCTTSEVWWNYEVHCMQWQSAQISKLWDLTATLKGLVTSNSKSRIFVSTMWFRAPVHLGHCGGILHSEL